MSKAFKIMNSQDGAAKMETMVKLILVFVISLLSFSVGTFVGKQFSDSQYKMASLEKEYNHSATTALNDEDKVKEGLTDEDIAGLTEEFVNAEKETLKRDPASHEKDDAATHDEHGAEHGKEVAHVDSHQLPAKAATAEPAHNEKGAHDAHGKSDQKAQKVEIQKEGHTAEHGHSAEHEHDVNEVEHKAHKPEHKDDATSRAADRVADEKSPTAPTAQIPVEKRRPTNLPSTVAANTVGKYTVQVASYALENEAKAHAKRLMDQGFSAFYLEADIKGKTWYRVSVGLFGTHEEAVGYRKTLVKQANLGSALIQKIVK